MGDKAKGEAGSGKYDKKCVDVSLLISHESAHFHLLILFGIRKELIGSSVLLVHSSKKENVY